MLRLMSASMPAARFSSIWRASCSSPRRISNITEAQIAEKPITVATEEAISSFADSRQAAANRVWPAFWSISRRRIASSAPNSCMRPESLSRP
jgi:hypothetical protein